MDDRINRLHLAVDHDLQALVQAEPDTDTETTNMPISIPNASSLAGPQPIGATPGSFGSSGGVLIDAILSSSVESNGGVSLPRTVAALPPKGANKHFHREGNISRLSSQGGGVKISQQTDKQDEVITFPSGSPRYSNLGDEPDLLDVLITSETGEVSLSSGKPLLAGSLGTRMQPAEANILTKVTNTLEIHNLQVKQQVQSTGGNTMAWLDADPCDSDLRTMTSVQHGDSALPKLELGDLAPFGKGFCPIVGLSKFPYKFVPASFMQEVAGKFFDKGQFWMRDWELYYVWPLSGGKPLFLVSEDQFEELLKEMQPHFPGVDMTGHQYYRDRDLIIYFLDHPRLRPRFLGPSHSRADYDYRTGMVPGAEFRAPGEEVVPPPGQDDRNIFSEIIEDAVDMIKSKNKASKAKRQEQRLLRQKMKGDQLKRMQRYLGLRPKIIETPPFDAKSSLLGRIEAEANFFQVPKVDIERPVPFPREEDAILIAFDVESYEHAHNVITEVGIAILDTRDIVDIHPGKNGQNWFARIEAQHLRIKDHDHCVNSTYVQGCPDRFNFGESLLVTLGDAPCMIEELLNVSAFSRAATISKGDTLPAESQTMPRPIVLIGHDPDGDIRYLEVLGYNVLSHPSLREVIDTQQIYQALKEGSHPPSLGNLLRELTIFPKNLHNAGNDAVYTMQGMIAMVVSEAANRPDSHGGGKNVGEETGEPSGSKLDRQAPETNDKGEDSDGGVKIDNLE